MNEQCVEAEARIARALITALGMFSENMQRQSTGNSMAYDEKAFNDLIASEAIGDNSIVYCLHPERFTR